MEMKSDPSLSNLQTLITEDDEGKKIQVGTKISLAVKVMNCSELLLCDQQLQKIEKQLQELMKIGLDAYSNAVKSHLAR